MSESGFFITLEGGEGSGKTTQINKLAETLTQKGRKVITTREPGGTEEAEKIRDLIVQRESGEWSPMAECLLLFASRAEHIDKKIRTALEGGKVVISDRFTDSTFAYQGYGHGFDLAKIEKLEELVVDGLKPDLTFVLDIDPETGLERSGRRLAAEQMGVKQTEDRFENLDLDFHIRVRGGFLEIAEKTPERCVVIDATLPPEEIAQKIEDTVMERLG